MFSKLKDNIVFKLGRKEFIQVLGARTAALGNLITELPLEPVPAEGHVLRV